MKKLLNRRGVVLTILFVVLIIVVIWLVKNQIPQPVVISTSPENGGQEVSTTFQPNINFNPNIDERAKPNISVSISPQTEIDTAWLSNTFKIVPKKEFNNATTYNVKVIYQKKEIFSFSFDTEIFNQKEIQGFGPIQTKNDLDYGKALTKIVNKYPFYSSLPIKTKDYVVYYDFEQNKFAITFLGSNITNEQKSSFIKEALVQIKNIGGVDPVQYYTQP